jgi:tetratricopeptide (TPR) repeat protein
VDLVGRLRELRALEDLLERAAGGSGGLVVVTGPGGSGRTTLADAAVELARGRGFRVVRAAPARGQPGRLVWAQLLGDVGAAQAAARLLAGDVGPLQLDRAARRLAAGTRRLVVVDDLDHGGPEAVELLAVLAGRLAAGATAVVVTAGDPLGLGRELWLGGLTEEELAAVVGPVPAGAGHALWVASRGLPGVARSLAATLADLGPGGDPLTHLALRAPSTAEFLDLDVDLVRLLETAAGRAGDDATRARVLARLAYELLADASAGPRRRELADQALALARGAGDRRTLAEVLDRRLHALWDPDAAADRLATASEILELARATGDGARERRGLFWRFVALMELGRVTEAESALAVFEREAAAAGDAAAAVMATARHAMLAVLRGRFEEAEGLAGRVTEAGRRAGVADTEQLAGTLRGSIAAERRDPSTWPAALELFQAYARRRPGHFYETTAARILLALGRETEAAAELQRLLPRVLTGSGPRWLGAATELAAVAAATGDPPPATGDPPPATGDPAAADGDLAAAVALYQALRPYDGRLVVWGGAVATAGPVSHYLGLLATRLGRPDDAVGHLQAAVAMQEQVGALPGLAHSLAALADALAARAGPGDAQAASDHRRRARLVAERVGMPVLLGRLARPLDEWSLARDGDDWLLEAGAERARLRDGRGLHYLRALLAAPGRDVPALDLAAGGAGLIAAGTDPPLDAAARAAYRRRLAELDAELEAADRAGDGGRAARADTERHALLGELRRASGLGGRPRTASAEAERARVNVTRTLRATIDKIALAAPGCAAHLRASVHTGRACRYQPAPGGPSRWHV